MSPRSSFAHKTLAKNYSYFSIQGLKIDGSVSLSKFMNSLIVIVVLSLLITPSFVYFFSVPRFSIPLPERHGLRPAEPGVYQLVRGRLPTVPILLLPRCWSEAQPQGEQQATSPSGRG
jgi:hypothetical protein